MLPTQSTTLDADAKALLISQFRGKPAIEGFLSAWIAPLQELENVLWDVINLRVLSVATNAQLDTLGDLVGEPRLGRTDTDYRAAIRVRIKVNRSKGQSEDVLQVAKLLDAACTYDEFAPLAWEVTSWNPSSPGDFIRLLTQAKAAGSYGNLVTASWPVADVMVWEDSSNATPTNLWESAL